MRKRADAARKIGRWIPKTLFRMMDKPNRMMIVPRNILRGLAFCCVGIVEMRYHLLFRFQIQNAACAGDRGSRSLFAAPRTAMIDVKSDHDRAHDLPILRPASSPA